MYKSSEGRLNTFSPIGILLLPQAWEERPPIVSGVSGVLPVRACDPGCPGSLGTRLSPARDWVVLLSCKHTHTHPLSR
jgi:hypothetical protein